LVTEPEIRSIPLIGVGQAKVLSADAVL
jgi:hypothetical protein